jgi:hypothetical protein
LQRCQNVAVVHVISVVFLTVLHDDSSAGSEHERGAEPTWLPSRQPFQQKVIVCSPPIARAPCLAHKNTRAHRHVLEGNMIGKQY